MPPTSSAAFSLAARFTNNFAGPFKPHCFVVGFSPVKFFVVLRGASFTGWYPHTIHVNFFVAALGQHRSGACSYCRARYRLPNRVCFVTVVVLSRVRSTLAFSHWSLRSYLHASHISPGFAASQFLRLLRDSSMSPLWTADARKMRFSFSCPCSYSSVAVLFCFVALFLCW